ncbi:MAG: transcriptional regulator, PadR family [Edaphobacter sp.]|nr:transcriptional regulator, PadR family [Edaphobacter sp.]
MASKKQAGEILQGTLDMLILRTLITGPAHGHTIAQVIEHTSENTLEVEQGSLYPLCTGLRTVGGCPRSGASAKRIGRRSSIG